MATKATKMKKRVLSSKEHESNEKTQVEIMNVVE